MLAVDSRPGVYGGVLVEMVARWELGEVGFLRRADPAAWPAGRDGSRRLLGMVFSARGFGLPGCGIWLPSFVLVRDGRWTLHGMITCTEFLWHRSRLRLPHSAEDFYCARSLGGLDERTWPQPLEICAAQCVVLCVGRRL